MWRIQILVNMKIDPLYLGIVAGILTASSMIPQLAKVLREKEAKQVSIPMILILLAGTSLWAAYGIMKDDYPIITTNSISFLINVALIMCSMKYKKQKK